MNSNKQVNIWKRLTIILSIFLIISVGYTILTYKNYDSEPLINNESLEKEMCTMITATPTWVNENKEIIGVGVQPFGNTSDIVIDALIKKEIYFLYNPGCGACEQQIEFFGDDWVKYVDSGFTVNCNEVMNG